MRHAANPATLLAALGALALLPAALSAQLDVERRLGQPVRFTGEVGSYGELYTISGADRRRPASTGRLFVRSQLELFGTVRVGLDLLYSTESGSGVTLGSSGRQSLNQIGITPEWRWGRAALGSFSDSYSSLTWDGVPLRGAGFAINPGPLRLAAFTGRAQKAVPGGATDGAYERRMSGGRIGFGRGEGGYVDIIFVRTADDPGSLRVPEPGEDAPFTGNPYAVTPEENVVLAGVTRVPLFADRLVVSAELAGSIHSRDRRAPILSDEALDEYSGLMRSFITPRASTYGDLAHNAQVELRRLDLPGSTAQSPRMLSAMFGYRYVGAGYVSLGLASLPADQRALNGRAQLRFRTWSATLQGMRQHDNLIGQKLATTTRDRWAASVSFRPLRTVTSSLRAGINTVGSDAEDPGRRMDFRSVTLGTIQTLAMPRGGLLRSLSLSYGYQESRDASPLRADAGVRAHDGSMRAVLELSRTLSLQPALGLALSAPGQADWSLRHTYSVAGQYRAPGGRWSSRLSLSNSRLHDGGSLQGAATARYRFTETDDVSLGFRSNRVSGLATPTGGFHEHTLSVRWTRHLQ